MDLNEPIWDFEIRDQLDLTASCWKTAYNQFQRLQAQGAPPEILGPMSEIVDCFAEAHGTLKQLQSLRDINGNPLFPQEPRS